MSYDLWFWRETKPIDQTPEQICDCIAEEKPLDGIATLPIDRIKGALVAAFPDLQDEGASMTWEGDGSYVQVNFPASASHVALSCGYKLLDDPDPINLLIEVVTSFGCALYDPQTRERFEQPEPSADGA